MTTTDSKEKTAELYEKTGRYYIGTERINELMRTKIQLLGLLKLEVTSELNDSQKAIENRSDIAHITNPKELFKIMAEITSIDDEIKEKMQIINSIAEEICRPKIKVT